MEQYAQALFFAIPGFVILIGLEFFIGRIKGVNTIRGMDTISSLSSGMTNILKDVLGLSIVIWGYDKMVDQIAIFDLPSGWWMYVIAFIGLDFAGYWSHRWQHQINLLWNEHIIHHSSEEYNLPCALRQTISTIFKFYFFLYIPMALIGVPSEVVQLIAPIHLFAQFWYHTKLIGRLGFLEKIIVTPSHHRVHHAINPIYLDKNFSQIFIGWDMLFGTFQKELDEEPPVFGVKRAVRTWNPFLINFQHFWLLFQDAWRTRNWGDKFKIWFMPTGWRPEDVKKKYPIEVIEDVHTQVKYDPPSSLWLKIWSWAQLIITLSLMMFLFARVGSLSYTEDLWYAGFLFISIFAYTSLMDRKKWAWVAEFMKAALGGYLLWMTGDWFGFGGIVPFGQILIGAYLSISFILSLVFILVEFRDDVEGQVATA